ncbi:TrmB family transcriptional regulator, partial [Candidatus Bathyarchaeota archaeon]
MSLTVSEALRKLGLTGYETKVYMALLKYGSLTAY